MQILWSNFLGVGNAVVSLLLIIDSVVYWFISQLFGLYVTLARARIFNSAMYADISNKVYLIVGVVALFILAYVLLQSIVNPDNFKKNGFDFVKKLAIGLIMIVLTPAIFNLLYKVQDVILTDNVIENVILGHDSGDASTHATFIYDFDNPNKTNEEYMSELEENNYSYASYPLDEDGTMNSGKVMRYLFTDDCKYDPLTQYSEALKHCDKLTIKKQDDTLIKSYGNYMAFILLESFLYPTVEGATVNANESNKAGGKVAAIGWGCVGGLAAAVVIGAVGAAGTGVTGGASLVAGLKFAGSVALASCGLGAATGSLINSGVSAINYEAYTWDMAKIEMIHEGEFGVITAFAGDDDKGVVGGEFNYTPIISTICGLVLVWMLLSYCIDLGLRAAKLAFYQLFAPVSFLLNTVPGQKDLLKNWITVVLTTWGEVFIRIFTMVAAVYLISSLDMIELEGVGIIAKGIIVMGIIAFVRQFPKLLGDLTGIKSENMKLGIMEKLGAGGVLAAGALIGGGLTAGVKNITNSWRNSKGQGLGKRIFSAAGSGIGGMASGGFRSAKGAGFKAKSLGDMKSSISSGAKAAHGKSQKRAAYRAAHPGAFGVPLGHLNDAWSGIKDWAGIDSFADLKEEKAVTDEMTGFYKKMSDYVKDDPTVAMYNAQYDAALKNDEILDNAAYQSAINSRIQSYMNDTRYANMDQSELALMASQEINKDNFVRKMSASEREAAIKRADALKKIATVKAINAKLEKNSDGRIKDSRFAVVANEMETFKKKNAKYGYVNNMESLNQGSWDSSYNDIVNFGSDDEVIQLAKDLTGENSDFGFAANNANAKKASGDVQIKLAQRIEQEKQKESK